MRKIILMSVIMILAFSCKKEDDEFINKYVISGFVQKGPFIQGSEVRIQELTSDLAANGKSYFTETNDDFGSFDSNSEIPEGFIDIATTGFYFNEVVGKLSNSFITLKGISYLNEEKTLNINILTTLSYDRIKYLIINDNNSFDEAKKKAQREVLKLFYIEIPDSILTSFEEMDISKSGISNSVLLAISSILQLNNSESELSELIKKISDDIKTDGLIDNVSFATLIRENSMNIDTKNISANLSKRYSELGLSITVPDFAKYVDSDGDGIINLYETANPIFSLPSGVYSTDTIIEISVATQGSIIHYTIDGSEPDATSPVYSKPFSIKGDNTELTIKAIAYKDNLDKSQVVSNTYKIIYPHAQYPTFSKMAGTYNSDIEVTISSQTADAVIYYTLDGSTPSENSPIYSNPISINNNGAKVYLRAVAKKEKFKFSSIASTYYSIDYSYNSEIFNNKLSLADFQSNIVGVWIGVRTCPWTPPINVEVTFYDDGTYGSKTLTPGHVAFYYSSDNEINWYSIYDLNADGSATGTITRFSEQRVTGGLRFIKFSEELNVLSFEFWHFNEYGPLKYTLTRVE